MKAVNAFLSLVLIGLCACHKPYYIQSHTEQHYTINKEITQDSEVLKMIKPYKMGVDTQMLVVIGHTDIPLSKAQPECTLGNFIADAQLKTAQVIDRSVQISVSNYGGIRLPYIAPGPITKGKLYELMPFDNMITIVEIPGDVLRQFCSHMAKFKGWPVSGMSFTIKDKDATDIYVQGKPLNDHLVYKVAVSDYIARGGDNCDFLSPLKKRFTSVFVRDAMIDYVMQLEQSNKPLHPVLEKRIQYAE